VAPDGERVAYSATVDGQDDLFVTPAGGGKEIRLTNTPGHEAIAGWTAGGARLVYAVYANDSSSVYASAPDGSAPSLLARVPGRGPELSPDGSRIITMAGNWTATKLLMSSLDGAPPRQITDGSSIAWNSRWSPDGKKIAYTGRKDSASELAVFVMDADGSHGREATHIAKEEGGAQCPSWSADGRLLAVQVNSRIRKKSAHIWVVDAVTGAARKLAPHEEDYVDETPSWFPDCKRIAFQSNRTGTMEVWVMNADGTGARQLTH
jgi:Tol biopolymer transport system component